MSGAAVVVAAADGFAAPSLGILSESISDPEGVAASYAELALGEGPGRGCIGGDGANFFN